MTVIEHLRQSFMRFPLLQQERLDIDCLRSVEGSYSIDSEPGTVQRTYMDGSTVHQLPFTISSRMFYSSDLQTQAENIRFFEALGTWLTAQTQRCEMPALGDKRTARTLEVVSSAYPFIVDSDEMTARYQIQLRLIYLQEV